MTVTEQEIQQTQERHAQEETRHKEQVIATLGIHPEMSDAEIGAHVGCSRQFVNRMRRQAGIEAPAKKTVDPHEALYNNWRSMLVERDMLDEYVSDMVLSDLKKLTGHTYNPLDLHAQAVGDALNMVSLSMGKQPLDTLLTVHEFLRNYVSILEHQGGNE